MSWTAICCPHHGDQILTWGRPIGENPGNTTLDCNRPLRDSPSNTTLKRGRRLRCRSWRSCWLITTRPWTLGTCWACADMAGRDDESALATLEEGEAFRQPRNGLVCDWIAQLKVQIFLWRESSHCNRASGLYTAAPFGSVRKPWPTVQRVEVKRQAAH